MPVCRIQGCGPPRVWRRPAPEGEWHGVNGAAANPKVAPRDLIGYRIRTWRGAGEVERGGLENRCPRKWTVGSNPTPSAIAQARIACPDFGLTASGAWPIVPPLEF